VGEVSAGQWNQLREEADADALTFADRDLETRWLRRTLE
jgi:hypothetical protein